MTGVEVFWLEQLAAEMPAGEAWLSPGERECLQSLRFAPRRADWKLGRWTAKCALADYLRLAIDFPTLAYLEIRSAPSGAPAAFLVKLPVAVTISLSHRAGTALCAVAPPGIALGCDLERIEPRSHAFVTDYFTMQEQRLIERVPQADRLRLVTLLWSAKESALKALGVGLRVDTRSVRIAPTFDSPPARHADRWCPLQADYADGRVFRGWWRETGGMVVTIAADPAPEPPRMVRRFPTSHS